MLPVVCLTADAMLSLRCAAVTVNPFEKPESLAFCLAEESPPADGVSAAAARTGAEFIHRADASTFTAQPGQLFHLRG